MKIVRRIAVPFVAATALAVPASASAGPLAFLGPVLEPVYHVQTGVYQFANNQGTLSAFTLVFSNLQSQENQQMVRGTLGNVVFNDVAVVHTYDHATDRVRWTISATTVNGVLNAAIVLRLNRDDDTSKLIIDGTLGGRPFHGETPPIVNPLYPGS